MPYKDPEQYRAYQRVYQRARYQRNPEVGATRAREARRANPDKAREYVRRWRSQNPEKFAECNRRWHREHPEAKIRWASINPFSHWAMESNSSHRKCGYSVEITTLELAEMAKQTPICPYCGVMLDYSRFKGMHLENSATADRMNNENVLRPNNMQIICLACNRRKRKRSHFEYLGVIAQATT